MSQKDPGAGAVPVAVPGRESRLTQGRRCSGGDGDGPDFDMLSRSLPTSGPILEPEPGEHSMLRPVVSNQSTYKPAVSTDETAPLLQAPCENDEAGDSPLFYHDTSFGRFWAIFSQVLLIQFIGCFDGTIMASSHPVITSYFGAANSASWLSTAFMLTSTTFQPIVGRLSDAVGRKPIFLGSVFLLAIGTLWCAAAGSIESFIVARALCGLAAGSSMTVGSIITSDLVPIEQVHLPSVWYRDYANRTDAAAGTNRA